MKASQRLFGLIDVVGPVAARISREHALVSARASIKCSASIITAAALRMQAAPARWGSTAVRSGWFVTWCPHALIHDGGADPAGITRSNWSMIRTNSVRSVVTRHFAYSASHNGMMDGGASPLVAQIAIHHGNPLRSIVSRQTVQRMGICR